MNDLPGGFADLPGSPANAARVALVRQVAADTLHLNNRTAWREFAPRLKKAGIPHRDALALCRDVWTIRKLMRAAARGNSDAGGRIT